MEIPYHNWESLISESQYNAFWYELNALYKSSIIKFQCPKAV